MTISRSCGTFKGVLLLEVVVEILKCDHAVENQPDFRVMLFSTIYEVFSPLIKSMRMITKIYAFMERLLLSNSTIDL